MNDAEDYLVIIESGADGYSAYIPDLPGCVTVGESVEEIRSNIREAMELYLDGLAEKGLSAPRPISRADHIAVRAASG